MADREVVGACHCCTIDVGLLMKFGDAEEVGVLLLAAGTSLTPRQSRLEVELVAAVGQWVLVPEGLTVITCRQSMIVSKGQAAKSLMQFTL